MRCLDSYVETRFRACKPSLCAKIRKLIKASRSLRTPAGREEAGRLRGREEEKREEIYKGKYENEARNKQRTIRIYKAYGAAIVIAGDDLLFEELSSLAHPEASECNTVIIAVLETLRVSNSVVSFRELSAR